jgi:hypothetical protein
MVAVNVTDWPYLDGLSEDTSVVVVGAASTTWVKPADVLVRKLVLPP